MKKTLAYILMMSLMLAIFVPSASAEQVTIRMFCADLSDVVDPLRDLVGEFEAETGMKVIIDTVPEAEATDKRNMILSSQSTDYDVLLTASNDLSGDIQAGWVVPINEYLSEDYDFSDFSENLLNLLKDEDGNLYGLPIRAETNIMMYRKDIFDELDIAVPTTIDEFTAAAEKMTRDTDGDGSIDFYGTAVRGSQGEAAYTFTYYLKSFGGHFLDTEMNAALTSDEAVEALKYYVGLNQKYAPVDAIIYTWDQVFAGVQNGTVGMIVESSIQAGILEDPDKSTVVGRIGYAVPPAGPAGSSPDLKSYGYNISAFSQNKEAAAKFIEWAVSERVQKYAFEQYGFAGITRNSVLDECSNQAPYFEAIKDAMAIGNIYYLPLIPECNSIYNATGEAIAAAQAGTEPAEALAATNEKIQAIIDDAGYHNGTVEIPEFILNNLG